MAATPLRVSIVIPTLNAAGEIGSLVRKLERQSLVPDEIIVVDSESTDGTLEKAVSSSRLVRTIPILRSDFNHGLTRHRALLQSTGEYVCFLTQDAVPVDENYLRNLVRPMEADASIALVSGRQLPKPNARRFEQLVRNFNYSDVPSVRTKKDLTTYGIKTFFASDACSAYRRDAYLSCGGFSEVNTNEDMLMAARFIADGWAVAYEPSAVVYHSHNLTPHQQFERNRQVGRFLREHQAALMDVSEMGEGGRLVKSVASQLLQERRIRELLAFAVDCAARLAGNRVGRLEASRSMKEIKKS